MFIAEGTLIDGKYEVLGTIGAGGMGVVYEVYHRALQRVVAVKMLSASSGIDDEDRARFEREALILSRLSHSNIVQFYAYGVWSGVAYIVMERVTGQSLQHQLLKNQPLKLSRALNIARQVCHGLQHVHANQVLHRDLKPTNVLLTDTGDQGQDVKLIDFGLAKLVSADGHQQLTQAGMALGSVMYASPEQCLGTMVDSRTDIYSLGCILYQMLTGYPPFSADNATAVMFQQINASVSNAEHWSAVPLELQSVISKCMAKEPECRYTSAAALDEDLKKILGGQAATLEGMKVAGDVVFRSALDPFHSAASSASRSHRKHLLLVALPLLTLGVIIGCTLLSGAPGNVESLKQPTSLRHQLHKLTHSNEETDESVAKTLFSAIESYKRDHNYSLDRSDLVLQAYARAIGHYYRAGDYALVRHYGKKALEDSPRIFADKCDAYFYLVSAYHEACIPVNCQVSLIPLLEETLKRYPNSGSESRCELYVALALDYLALKRFDSARQAARQAASIARDVREKTWCSLIAKMCDSADNRGEIKANDEDEVASNLNKILAGEAFTPSNHDTKKAHHVESTLKACGTTLGLATDQVTRDHINKMMVNAANVLKFDNGIQVTTALTHIKDTFASTENPEVKQAAAIAWLYFCCKKGGSLEKSNVQTRHLLAYLTAEQQSGNPERKLSAARVRLAFAEMTGADYFHTCEQVLKSRDASRELKMQAITGLGMSVWAVEDAEQNLKTGGELAHFRLNTRLMSYIDLERKFLEMTAGRNFEASSDLQSYAASVLFALKGANRTERAFLFDRAPKDWAKFIGKGEGEYGRYVEAQKSL